MSPPLKNELIKTFNCKVILENDTTMGGIGEAVKGAGVGYSVVAEKPKLALATLGHMAGFYGALKLLK